MNYLIVWCVIGLILAMCAKNFREDWSKAKVADLVWLIPCTTIMVLLAPLAIPLEWYLENK